MLLGLVALFPTATAQVESTASRTVGPGQPRGGALVRSPVAFFWYAKGATPETQSDDPTCNSGRHRDVRLEVATDPAVAEDGSFLRANVVYTLRLSGQAGASVGLRDDRPTYYWHVSVRAFGRKGCGRA
ncbi:MAG: hypothetical protein JWN65_2721 [Solirubrobacterales bacterium]|nr:hypothetical protein [Solirubrobacterales bacterium]